MLTTKAGRDKDRKQNRALEKTGCASLYAMAKTPEGRQAEVIQMRDKTRNDGEERKIETTQVGITKIHEEHFDQLFNLHKNTLAASITPEADEEARNEATENAY